MRNPVCLSSGVTPAGTSNELDVQNGWEENTENTHTHTYIQEKRRKSARNRKIVVDAVRETGDTRVERETNVEKKGLVQQLPTQIISNKEAEGEAQDTRGSSNNCTSRESVSPLSRLIRGFRSKYH